MATANYYRMFALQPNASDVDIKRRYRQLSFEHHPDRGGSAEMMMQINEAYSVLSNGLLRREYDQRYAAQQSANRHDDFVHTRPGRTQTSTATREYYHPPTPQPAQRSAAWMWFAGLAMVAFIFVAFMLHDVLEPAMDTNNDVPVSGFVNSQPRNTHQSQNYYRNNSAPVNSL